MDLSALYPELSAFPGFGRQILYLTLAIFVIYQVRNVSVNIVYMLYPIVAWVSFATIYVIFQLLAR